MSYSNNTVYMNVPSYGSGAIMIGSVLNSTDLWVGLMQLNDDWISLLRNFFSIWLSVAKFNDELILFSSRSLWLKGSVYKCNPSAYFEYFYYFLIIQFIKSKHSREIHPLFVNHTLHSKSFSSHLQQKDGKSADLC